MAAKYVTLKNGNSVVFLTSDENIASENAKKLQERFSQDIGATGRITAVPINLSTNEDASLYDVCVVGFDFPFPVSEDVVARALKLLKPNGMLWILEAVVETEDESEQARSKERLQSFLKLNGFVDVELKAITELPPNEIQKQLKEKLRVKGNLQSCCFSARKPSYEIGASAALKLGSGTSKNLTAAQVWTLSANDLDDDDDAELLDSDKVLDEEDLKKPDAASLRSSCDSAATKRKACKNCSCGLAEELEAEKVKKEMEGVDPGQKKSSCGSCYLGDAFRCSTCPYRGMPAFKPGEKVILQ